jgi:hypothetical protein
VISAAILRTCSISQVASPGKQVELTAMPGTPLITASIAQATVPL